LKSQSVHASYSYMKLTDKDVKSIFLFIVCKYFYVVNNISYLISDFAIGGTRLHMELGEQGYTSFQAPQFRRGGAKTVLGDPYLPLALATGLAVWQ